MDGLRISTEAFFISIANIANQFGNNLPLRRRKVYNDLAGLDIVVVNKMSKWQMAWKVLQQVRGGRVRMYDDKNTTTAVFIISRRRNCIRNPGMAPPHIDGDPAASAPFL